MISFFNLYELFPAFICANNIGSLVNSLSEVKFFNPISCINSPVLSSSGVSDEYLLSDFCLLNFNVSAIVSSSCDLLLSSSNFLHHLS